LDKPPCPAKVDLSMRFLNFSLGIPTGEISVQADGLDWDLHNLADFSGLTVGTDGTATLEWRVYPNPYRPADHRFSGCALIFRGLTFLKIGGRDPEMPADEDLTLDGISRVTPDATTPERTRDEWAPETPFHLLFVFLGGLSIEIAADEAEFRARPKVVVEQPKGRRKKPVKSV